MPKFSPITVYILLAVIVGFFYGNTLANGFVHDDVWQVVNNQQIRSLNIGRIFGGCIAEELLGGCEGRGFYWRPMQALSNALVYQISQSPKFFHVVNLVYFWIAGMLVYELVANLVKSLRSPPQKTVRPDSSNKRSDRIGLTYASARHNVGGSSKQDSGLASSYFLRWFTSRSSVGDNQLLALFSAIFFVTHPINSEVVNWISATPELLMTIFFLLSLLCYLKYLKSPKSFKLLALSAVFFFLAMLSKETAVFLVAALPAYHLLSFPRKRESSAGFRIKSGMTGIMVFFIPLVIYLLFRTMVLGRVVYKYEGFYSLSFGDQVFTGLALLPRYLLKLIYPVPLSFQTQLSPVREVGDLWVIAGIGVIVLAGILGWFLWARGQRLILFGLFFLLLGFSPALVFVNKLGEFIFAERYLLVSTVGLAIVAAEAVRFFLGNDFNIFTVRVKSRTILMKLLDSLTLARRITILAVIAICLFVSSWFVVFTRSRDWKDDLASYQAMIRIDKSHKKAQFQLGEIYRLRGDIAAARAQYELALSIDPNYQEAQVALARVSRQYVGEQLSFYYPEDWELVEKKDEIILYDLDKKFEVQIEVNKINSSPDEYLKSQKETLGKLVNEGRALIPGFDEAWVKVWQIQEGQRDKGTKFIEDIKLQFFLFAKGKVVKVLVSDANSPQMKVFEGILLSMRI